MGEEHQEITKVLKMFERKDGNKSGDEKDFFLKRKNDLKKQSRKCGRRRIT